MTILQMEYFIAVAECGSFSKAAVKMFVSQQGISRQIAAVEQELDMTLIDRSNRRRITTAKMNCVTPDRYSGSFLKIKA